MVTAHGREKLSQRSAAEQALLDGFLVKPVTASMLLDAVVDRRGRRAQPHRAPRAGRGAGRRLAGLRLLVAEDNANNQQVARELLEDEGAVVHDRRRRAGGGGGRGRRRDAAFDAVLMDLQMPVMDGFTATGRIRHDLGRAHLPIVAMTANAMASDREACLAAGMNDHVGKPFDLDATGARAAARWRGRPCTRPNRVRAAAAARAAAPLVASAPRAAGVDLAAALQRLGGKPAGLPAHAAQLHRTTWPACPRSCGRWQRATPAAASRLLHTLKGLAATLGVRRLAAAGGRRRARHWPRPPRPRRPGRDREPAVVAIERRPARALLASAAGPAGRRGRDRGAGAAGRPRPVDTCAALRELAGLLENSDMRATDACADCGSDPAADAGRRWHALDDAVAGLDFERALRLCRPTARRGPAHDARRCRRRRRLGRAPAAPAGGGRPAGQHPGAVPGLRRPTTRC